MANVLRQERDRQCIGHTLKTWYNEPRYSEIHDIVNKTQFLYRGFTKHITFWCSELFNIVNKKVWRTCSLYRGLSVSLFFMLQFSHQTIQKRFIVSDMEKTVSWINDMRIFFCAKLCCELQKAAAWYTWLNILLHFSSFCFHTSL